MADSIYERVFDLAKRRGFVYPGYELYGGAAGFYDYGPLGAALKANLEAKFRQIYVVEEGAAEISTPAITIEPVLKASGHVDHFSDMILTCRKCQSGFRADHFLPEEFERISKVAAKSKAPDAYKQAVAAYAVRASKGVKERPTREVVDDARMRALVMADGRVEERSDPSGLHFTAPGFDEALKCPNCAHDRFEPAAPFNLMFKTFVGPGAAKPAYLRPETAQAMFINFPNLLRYFRDKLPFAAAQIGRAYRNEIAPRQGLIRLREFNQMEVEAFFDPKNVDHAGFDRVKATVLNFVPNTTQEPTPLSIGDAVAKKMVNNRALGYHLVLVQRLLIEAGIDPAKLRFRQHLKDEMAHYANDCWDAEYLSERFGWVECVGVADRSTYDVSQHAKHSGKPLTALRRYDEPVRRERTKVLSIPAKLGPLFKKDAGKVTEALMALGDGAAKAAEKASHLDVSVDGYQHKVPRDAYTVVTETETVTGEPFVPHVIEPSFGEDRIIYAILEHNLRETVDQGEAYTTLTLPPAMAPVTVGVFPLMSKDGLDTLALEIEASLRQEGVRVTYDDSGSIGRRYARADEIGVPFCITVDYDSMKDQTVTLRERDTSTQRRVPIARVHEELKRALAVPWKRTAASAAVAAPNAR